MRRREKVQTSEKESKREGDGEDGGKVIRAIKSKGQMTDGEDEEQEEEMRRRK